MWTNTKEDLVKGIYNFGTDILKYSVTNDDISKYKEIVESEKLNYPVPKNKIDHKKWFMPAEYKDMDIEKFLVDCCPEENYDRLVQELQEYKQRDLLDLLRQMKYIVDILRANNIVWGVGRGSSVASYVLFLLGVHKIDSVKYKLPLDEFFKGENDGKSI